MDRRRYPRFFRLIPSLQQFADENVAIVNEFKWKRVAIVAHSSEFLLDVSVEMANSIYMWLSLQ